MNVAGAATLDTNTSVSVANAVSLGNGSTLTLGGSNALALSGGISGAGGLVKNGPATTTLTGANTYGRHDDQRGHAGGGAGGSLAATAR